VSIGSDPRASLTLPTGPTEGRELDSVPGELGGLVGAGAGSTDDGAEHEAEVARMARVWWFGALVWGSSISLDWLAVTFVEPGPIAWFAALRGAELAVIVAVAWRLGRKPTLSARAVVVLDVMGNALASLAVALMALKYRGLASPYAHGVSCVLVARGITLAEPWRRGVVRVGVTALVYPVAMVVMAALGLLGGQLRDPRALAVFAQNTIWILSTAGLLVIGAHIVWSLRGQVSEARKLGRYKLERVIGSGAMGEVWLARHRALKQAVAVKVLKPGREGRHTVARFEREVRAMTRLRHPNTVRVFDYGRTVDGLWYYVMELLEGETLSALVKREGALSPARAVAMVTQAARALGEAHAMGVVHRDLKPENLFVTALGGEADFIKVLDFGVAKVMGAGAGDPDLTGDDALLGTPAFMSPEQITGEATDARSDVYALGAVLSYALTGKKVFTAATVSALLVKHMHEAPAAPSERAPGPLPAGLDALVLRCLAKSPAERYADGAKLAEALKAIDVGAVVATATTEATAPA
jgi:serine/threonine-protein kinase